MARRLFEAWPQEMEDSPTSNSAMKSAVPSRPVHGMVARQGRAGEHGSGVPRMGKAIYEGEAARMNDEVAKRAVARYADEMGRAILYLRALKGLYTAETYHSIDFIRLTTWALYDSIFVHVIKVLHPREQAGFWRLYRANQPACERICAAEHIDLARIKAIEPKLLLIRDKTHFHLDTVGVVDPAKVWADANLSMPEVEEAMTLSFRLLSLLHRDLLGHAYELPDYDGSDATRIAEAACDIRTADDAERRRSPGYPFFATTVSTG